MDKTIFKLSFPSNDLQQYVVRYVADENGQL